MNIVTKFNLKDKVFAIVNNQIIKVVINEIIVNVKGKSTSIWYEINWEDDKFDKRSQYDIYATKEDLIKDF